jgi:7-cyano-7-deazaguanine synthase
MNTSSIPLKKAVVLLSGGLDSATVLAIARAQGYECYALSFDYGQRHRYELQAAKKVAEALGAVEHRTALIDLRTFGGSALTADIDVPKDRNMDTIEHEVATNAIPSTYVPARNTIFLSFALAFAETLGAFDIFLGVNAMDYSGYPDCRPEFIEAFARMANLGTAYAITSGREIQFHTPLLQLSKADIVREGMRLGVDYRITSSCYDPAPNGAPCGRCDTCQLRAKGFAEAGLDDPLVTFHATE